MWGIWIERGVRLLPLIVGAVHAVERLVTESRGPAKQDAAVEATKAMLAAVEIGVDKDLLNDAEVERAVRLTIDAYVFLQNVIASKTTAAPAP